MAGSGFSFGRGGGDGQPKAARTPVQRLIYWGSVLAVWGVIFLVVFFAVFARDLPDTAKKTTRKIRPQTASTAPQ